jgi:hypothetical protein
VRSQLMPGVGPESDEDDFSAQSRRGQGRRSAFRNEYWPALYFIDSQGRVRHHYFGEGSYQQSEMIIQELLAETGFGGIDRASVLVDARGIEAGADWGSLRSPENYVGYERTQNFASPGGAVLDICLACMNRPRGCV